jgi:hypothetical protein
MEFKAWLELKDSDPVIVEQLILGLSQWQVNNIPIRTEGQMLLISQDIVGCVGILEGCLSREWGRAQERYFQQKASRRSGPTWLTHTIRRIWTIAWEMWQHRNAIEHHNDVAKENAELDQKITEEIEKGSDHTDDITPMLLQMAESESLSKYTREYKRSWLRGIKAFRERHKRRGLGDNIMYQMRRTMRQFLVMRGT